MPTQLTATDLSVRYNTQVVLDQATLTIGEGDRIGLVGRNGCGKTTFLKILAGLQVPDSGSVTPRHDLVISYLPQDFTLDPTRSVFESVREGGRHVLGLIAEFEALPADSKRHAELGRSQAAELVLNWGRNGRETPGETWAPRTLRMLRPELLRTTRTAVSTTGLRQDCAAPSQKAPSHEAHFMCDAEGSLFPGTCQRPEGRPSSVP